MNNKFLIVSIIVFLLSLSIVCASDVNESQSEKTQTLEVDNDDINSNVNDYNIVSENIGKKNESDSEKINREYKNKTVKRDDESSDISLIVSATDIKYGDTASIFGTLNNNNTVPLMQEEITLLLNDEEYTTTTDVNGEYNFSITDYDIGLNEVVVFYDGETDFVYFTLDEITRLSKVTEKVVKGFLKMLNLPVPKTVYDEFSKDLNLLFKLDTEPLAEHSILNKATYEIFCSRLGQEKSNIMGICYFYYGFFKEAVENFYHDHSEKAIMNITLSMENEILELFHEQYKIISLLNLNKSLIINDYEHYYVAEDYYDTMSVVL